MEGMTPVQEKHLMTCHHETRQVSDDSSVALRLGRLGLAMGHALNSSKAPRKEWRCASVGHGNLAFTGQVPAKLHEICIYPLLPEPCAITPDSCSVLYGVNAITLTTTSHKVLSTSLLRTRAVKHGECQECQPEVQEVSLDRAVLASCEKEAM